MNNTNSITIIKNLCAVIIIFSHSVAFLGIADIRIPAFVVPIFFAISGYLIYSSLNRNKTSFLKKRFIRIYPSLWLCLIINLLIVVALHKEVLSNKYFYVYNILQGTFFQFYNPQSLSFYGMGQLNPSLWTMSISIQFYIVAYFIYKRIKIYKIKKDMFILIQLCFLSTFIAFLGNYLLSVYSFLSKTILAYAYLFYIGILFNKYKNIFVPLFKKYGSIIFILFSLTLVFEKKINIIPHIPYISNLLISSLAAILALGIGLSIKCNKKIYDISFEMYLYHMIVVNFMIEKNIVHNWYLLLIVFTVTIILSIIAKFSIKIIINRIETKS